MKIICDKCNKKFEHTKIKLKETKITDNITQIYYKCPKCKFKYVVGYKDNEIRENIKRIKNLKGEFLRKQLTVEEYEKGYKDIIERNNSLNARYKALYGR